MAQYGTCECSICYRRVPKPDARKITIERVKGRSGGSFRFGRRSSSYYTGRTYYGQKDVWICDDCYPAYTAALAAKQAANARAVVIIIILLGVGFAFSAMIGSKGNITTQSSPSYKSAESPPASVPPETANYYNVKFTPPPQTPSAVPMSKDIPKIQARLIELGYLQGPADGLWGPRSRQALFAFKVSNGLTADDNIEPALMMRLQSDIVVRGPLPVQKLAPAGVR